LQVSAFVCGLFYHYIKEEDHDMLFASSLQRYLQSFSKYRRGKVFSIWIRL